MSKTLDIIHREHQALAAVLQTMRQLAASYAERQTTPDFQLLATMLDYLAEVPEKLHHPKEEQLLHKALRPKAPEAAASLDRLLAEHRDSPHMVDHLARALVHFVAVGVDAAPEFKRVVDDYVRAIWEHMSLEEREIMPLARRVLSPEEWRAIDAEFEANPDPYRGAQGEFDAMFKRIVQHAPAPYGVGDSA